MSHLQTELVAGFIVALDTTTIAAEPHSKSAFQLQRSLGYGASKSRDLAVQPCAQESGSGYGKKRPPGDIDDEKG
jgi:hypothetical protein